LPLHGIIKKNQTLLLASYTNLSGFRDRALYGIGLEPLLVDPLLLEPIHVNTSVLGYEVI
jgi:hypothetical protein